MPTLEEVLLAQGLVTRDQIEEARTLDADLRGGLGLNLIRLRYLTEEAVVEAVRRAAPGIRVVDQAALSKASSFALGLVPITMVERRRIVPVALQGSALTLAMADPLDAAAIDEVQRHTRCTVAPAVAAESVISWALLRYFNVLTPAYSPASSAARAAAVVSLDSADPESAAAIPLTRRRRAPMGDAAEDLDQIPVDLLVKRRKSQPPPPPPPDLGVVEDALSRIERRRKRTARAIADLPATAPPTGPPAPPAEAVAEPEAAAVEPFAYGEAATPTEPSEPGDTQQLHVAPEPVVVPPVPIPPPTISGASTRAAAGGARYSIGRGQQAEYLVEHVGPAAQREFSMTQQLPTPKVPPAMQAAGPPKTLPIGLAPPAKPATPLPVASPRPATRAERARLPTPKMGLVAPFVPPRAPTPPPQPAPLARAPAVTPPPPPVETAPPPPGAAPGVAGQEVPPTEPSAPAGLSDGAVETLRNAIRAVGERDEVLDIALRTLEQAVGAAAFLTRKSGSYVVHRAGARFVDLFGESEHEARPGQNTVFARGFVGADPQISPSGGGSAPLRPTRERPMPEHALTIPILVLGRTVGVVLVLADAPHEALAARMRAYRTLADVLGEKLLALIKAKKGR